MTRQSGSTSRRSSNRPSPSRTRRRRARGLGGEFDLLDWIPVTPREGHWAQRNFSPPRKAFSWVGFTSPECFIYMVSQLRSWMIDAMRGQKIPIIRRRHPCACAINFFCWLFDTCLTTWKNCINVYFCFVTLAKSFIVRGVTIISG